MSSDFLAVDIQPRIDAMIKELRQLGEDAERGGLMAGLRGGIKPVKRAIKRETPVSSGALKKSIGHRVVAKRDLSALQIASGAALFTGPVRKVVETLSSGATKRRSQNYKARFLEEGTKAHTIKRKKTGARSGVLNFIIGGRAISATKINHPGTAKNEFIKRAWNASTGEYQQAFYKGLANYLSKRKAAA